jgi:predicted amidohydrolase YtcJ
MLEQDEQLKGRYIMLDRVDVHCIWVSQAVLDLLPSDIADVPGGEIVRDPGLGVFCDNAMTMIMDLWPRPGADKKKQFIKSAMTELNKVGLVGMHDAGVLPSELKLFEDMSKTDDWTVRVYAMLECPERNTFCPDLAFQISQENHMLSCRSVKLFAGKFHIFLFR